jgi:cobaltochelatase CobS
MGASGRPIPVTIMGDDPDYASMIPDIDPNYVFNIEILKTLMMGIEMKIPTYLWGHAGTGKTSIFEQIAARTKRAFFRVQHTANMEEEHIVGGWRLRDGKTFFELGPLAMAMKYGWMYMADEYDFGRPEVTSVYQAVLERKPLVIKEADPENRVIRPHANFCIIATGNTNGQGDESGLYQGTSLQNAANYERFGVVEQMPYMDKVLESHLVSKQANIPIKDAEKLVDFAGRIRLEFDGGRIGNPISPRSLIYAAQIGVARSNYRIGLEKAFINRLASTDRESASQVAQRVFA